MNEITALLTSFTHLKNITEALLSLRDFEKLNAKVYRTAVDNHRRSAADSGDSTEPCGA